MGSAGRACASYTILSTLLFGVSLIGSAASPAATLEEAVRQSLSTSPDTLIDVQERLARDQALRQARGGYLPDVDLRAAYGREGSDNVITRAAGNPDNVWLTRQEAELNLRQMLFDGFATRSEVERQTARVSSSAYRVHAGYENTALRTTEVYLEVLKRRELLELARRNLATHEAVHAQVVQRTESGLGRRADLEQADARLALARANVETEDGNLTDAQTSYLRVVGVLPDEDMKRPTPAQGLLPASIDQATDQALANHPTLKSAEADVEAAMAQHEAAKHAFYPRFDIEAGRFWGDNLDGLEGYDNDARAMLVMRYNLYNGGADQARSRETAYLVNEAKEVRARSHRQVVESIRLSWNALQANERRLKPLRQHVQASQATREAYRKQFDIGERTLLDLLDSENELFEARITATGADYDSLFARYRILAGIAKLVASLGVELPTEASPLDRQY